MDRFSFVALFGKTTTTLLASSEEIFSGSLNVLFAVRPLSRKVAALLNDGHAPEFYTAA